MILALKPVSGSKYRIESASRWSGLFDRLAAARAANDNVDLKDFVRAAKDFDRQDRVDRREERQSWRSYRTGRKAAFNDVVQGAERSEGRDQAQEQDVGLGQGFGRSMS